MASVVATPDLARAAGWDAGNRSMRDAGRTRWNEDDWNEAARTTNELMRLCLANHNQCVDKGTVG